MSDIKVFEVCIGWQSEPTMHSGSAMVRFHGEIADRDRFIEAAETAGFTIDRFKRLEAQTADDAIAYLKKELSLVAFVTQRSPLRDVPASDDTP